MNDWMKIIFLDIDGVLVSEEYQCTHIGCLIEPAKCELLNQLEDLKVKVVISSSWGDDDGRTEKSLRGCGLTLPIIGYTDHYHMEWICRGNEIEKWISETFGGMGTKYYQDYDGIPYHRKRRLESVDYEYAIIDDDQDMLYGQKDNFVHINRITGITQEDIDKIRKILTRDGTVESKPSQE